MKNVHIYYAIVPPFIWTCDLILVSCPTAKPYSNWRGMARIGMQKPRLFWILQVLDEDAQAGKEISDPEHDVEVGRNGTANLLINASTDIRKQLPNSLQ